MSRRLLAFAVAAISLVTVTGCADDVSPAVQVGDTKVSDDALLDEVAEWRASPTLLEVFQLPEPTGGGPETYPTSFVDLVLTNRIIFEVHRAKFEELGLEIADQDVRDMRAGGLLNDAARTRAVLDELSGPYGDRLVEDVVRQTIVQNALGEEYEAWAMEAFSDAEIEVSPRYGRWDPASGQVVPPEGPTQPAPVGF